MNDRLPAVATEAGEAIRARRADLAGELAQPGLSPEDAGDHLDALAEALRLESPALFADYVAWAKVVRVQRGILAADLERHLRGAADVLRVRLRTECGALAGEYIAAAVRAMPGMPEDVPTFMGDDAPESALAHQYLQALLRGSRHVASRLVLEACERGTPIKSLYLHVFQASQREIGRLWQMNRISVAQEHYCTAATQLIMSQLYPRLFAGPRSGRTLVAACVGGDLHELGARMVADFFEMAGWNTYYIGASTPTGDILSAVVERKADLLAISATITGNLHGVRALVEATRARPECARVAILVGGYPFNSDPQLWRRVGADGFGRDADEALAAAERLLTDR